LVTTAQLAAAFASTISKHTSMKTIPFTQFLRPDGRQKPVTIEGVSEAAFAKYEEAARLGCRMTCEELTTGEASMCIEHPEGDFDCVVVPNGPGVKEAVEGMLLRFTEGAFREWLASVT
jgi:hypothetical protein